MIDRIARARPVLDLIIKHESLSAVAAQSVSSPYDVVWGGIAKLDRPRKLSAMTIERVLYWQELIDATYQSEAAGAYQIMEDTLRGLTFRPAEIFNEATQDALALQLLDRRGWSKCEAGGITVEAFANQLAREWASLPVVTDQRRGKRVVNAGQSYYAGDGLNKAHAKPAEVLAAIRAALAPQSAPVTVEPPPARPVNMELRLAAVEAALRDLAAQIAGLAEITRSLPRP